MWFHKVKELSKSFFKLASWFGVVFDLPIVLIRDYIIDFLDYGLPKVVLWIGINWIELTIEPVKNKGDILVVYFLFFTKVNASDPLVFDFLEWGLDFHDDWQFVEHVPEKLEFSIEVPVSRRLWNVGQGFELCICLLYFTPFIALSKGIIILLGSFWIWFFWRHGLVIWWGK